MYDELNAFLEQDFVMRDKFKIHNPTIDEIRKYGEEKYWLWNTRYSSDHLSDAGLCGLLCVYKLPAERYV